MAFGTPSGGTKYKLEVFPSLKMPNLDHIFPNTKPYLVVKINDNQVPTTK